MTACDAFLLQEVLATLQRMARCTSTAKPIESYVTHWHKQRYSAGSYSYQAVGSSLADIHALATPEWDGRLHFAGEATSVEGFQCVHGAYETGMAVAQDLLAALGRKSMSSVEHV